MKAVCKNCGSTNISFRIEALTNLTSINDLKDFTEDDFNDNFDIAKSDRYLVGYCNDCGGDKIFVDFELLDFFDKYLDENITMMVKLMKNTINKEISDS